MRSKNAVSVPISGGNGSNRLEVFRRTSTLWLMLPTNTIEAEAAFSSLPRAKEPKTNCQGLFNQIQNIYILLASFRSIRLILSLIVSWLVSLK